MSKKKNLEYFTRFFIFLHNFIFFENFNSATNNNRISVEAAKILQYISDFHPQSWRSLVFAKWNCHNNCEMIYINISILGWNRWPSWIFQVDNTTGLRLENLFVFQLWKNWWIGLLLEVMVHVHKSACI
jgi:hypothetical protein